MAFEMLSPSGKIKFPDWLLDEWRCALIENELLRKRSALWLRSLLYPRPHCDNDVKKATVAQAGE